MKAELGRILLAEDSVNDVELTLRARAEHRIANDVDVVRDGAAALDYLYCRGRYSARDHSNPTLVLLDLKMPKISGLEVLKEIKADPRLKTIPVVMLTSSREEADLVDSYQLGVNAYVVKPIGFTDFLGAVRQIGGFWAVVNEAPPRSASQ